MSFDDALDTLQLFAATLILFGVPILVIGIAKGWW